MTGTVRYRQNAQKKQCKNKVFHGKFSFGSCRKTVAARGEPSPLCGSVAVPLPPKAINKLTGKR
jgi:hypothetical protein